MISANQIREHMEVRALDGAHVGIVDHLEGPNQIRLTRSDSPNEKHHLIPLNWVDHVDEHVHLSRNLAEICSEWIAIA
jgi:Uncharacterized protein conserved in bacteria